MNRIMNVGSRVLILVHFDHRRTIYENNDVANNSSIQGFKIFGTSPLGLHAHARKTEYFHILRGGGIILLQLSHNGQPVHSEDKPEKRKLRPGSSIFVPKNMAHTFYLELGTEMICFSSKAFDPNDMDMVSCPWLKL